MIKTLSPYYITTSWISPLTSLTATSYTLDIFVWNGGKGNSGTIPTYSITKTNIENSVLTDDIDISKIVNDFLEIRPVSSDVTDNINGDNQIWCKTQVYYTTSDTNELNTPQNITTQLVLKGYGYGMDGKNAQPPSNKILLEGSEFNVNKNGVFNVPVIIDEVDSTIDAVNDSYTIVNSTQDLNVLANDDLGFTPTTITYVASDLDVSTGQFVSLGNLVQYQSNDTILSNVDVIMSYTITDSTGASDTATVNVTIEPLPITVTAIDDYYDLNNEDVVILDVMANDILGTQPTDIISFDDTGLTSGSITNNGADLTFTPNGIVPMSNETFTYTIEDDTTATSQATVTLSVTSSDTRYLHFVVNIGMVSGTLSGEYLDGTPFSFDVEGGTRVDINRCVIESSLVADNDVITVFDDNINC